MANHLDATAIAALPVNKYDEVRSQLRSGDLFFCSGNYLISKAIQKVTNSPWSHVGIVFVVEEVAKVLLLESVEDVGVRLAPVSKYLTDYENGAPYDGMLAFARTTAAKPKSIVPLAQFGLDQLTLPYDEAEIGYILARITLHLGKQKDKHGYICSELVYACFDHVGYKFHDDDDFVTPEDVRCDSSVTLLARVQ